MKMDILPYNNDNFVLNFPPLLRRNIEELFFYGKIGLVPFTFNDITPLTKQYTEDDSVYIYHYTLKVPYAGKRLSWELIFNPEDLTFAPDFNFNDDNFLNSPDIDVIIDNIPSLVNWNVKNPKCLASVLEELISLYKRTQLSRLHKENIYSQICTEFDHMTREEITLNDVELQVENTSVHFLINMKVDTSSLPQYLQPLSDQCDILLNPGEDTAVLKVAFTKLDGSRTNASLQLSPRLEQVLGTSKTLHIPSYTKQTSLAEYVALVTKLLQDLVKKVEQHHQLKKELVTSLCTVRSNSMIEYDSESFSTASFLCEVEDYFCIVHISIGNNFPQEKPVVTLQSVYCAYPNKPCTEIMDDYPYSPRWSAEEMRRRLLGHLSSAILKFKNHKH